MALSNQAALLDELFGVDRNSTTKKEMSWDDETMCKYYLAGFCPHDLFVNTKMSLGQCPKVHDSKLFDKYRNSCQILKMGYERRLKSFLQRYVDDVKKKIVYNVERLDNGLLSGTEVGIQKRITALEREINELVKKIEGFGNEGRIEDCRNLNCELEEKQKTLKYDRIELETQRRNTRERLEEVCNTCGAYISKNDPRNSLENHVSGRIHCSYVKINEVLNDLNETILKAERNSEERLKSIEKDRSRNGSRHRHESRDKKHDRNRDNSDESHRHNRRSNKNSKYSRSRSREKNDKRRERNVDYDNRKERRYDDKQKEDYNERKERKYDNRHRNKREENSIERKDSGKERKDYFNDRDKRKVDHNQQREREDDKYKRKESKEDIDEGKEKHRTKNKKEDGKSNCDKESERERKYDDDKRKEVKKDNQSGKGSKENSWGEI